MEPITINDYSFASYMLNIMFNIYELSKATGYIYKYKNKDYLITNKHVVTGINTNTREILDKNGMIPNILIVNLFEKEIDGIIKGIKEYKINLYDGDNNPIYNNKLWYEYEKNSKIDVVAIPININLNEYTYSPINEIQTNFNENTKEMIADDVFVLGYPKGISIINTPIWKKASIASEPEIDIDDMPKFYIDTATRDGMSGSPVILYKKRAVTIYDNKESPIKCSTHYNKLLGTYSGRILGEDEFSAQLGVVWKAKTIEEIINEAEYEGQVH